MLVGLKNKYYGLANLSAVAQLCLILCDPMDYSLPGSFVQGIFQARILEWVAISFSLVSLANNVLYSKHTVLK